MPALIPVKATRSQFLSQVLSSCVTNGFGLNYTCRAHFAQSGVGGQGAYVIENLPKSGQGVRLLFACASIGLSMRELLDQVFVHPLNVIKWHPGPKHLYHHAVLFFWVFEDVKERLSGKTSVSAT